MLGHPSRQVNEFRTRLEREGLEVMVHSRNQTRRETASLHPVAIRAAVVCFRLICSQIIPLVRKLRNDPKLNSNRLPNRSASHINLSLPHRGFPMARIPTYVIALLCFPVTVLAQQQSPFPELPADIPK